jgi:hypothetical protein
VAVFLANSGRLEASAEPLSRGPVSASATDRVFANLHKTAPFLEGHAPLRSQRHMVGHPRCRAARVILPYGYRLTAIGVIGGTWRGKLTPARSGHVPAKVPVGKEASKAPALCRVPEWTPRNSVWQHHAPSPPHPRRGPDATDPGRVSGPTIIRGASRATSSRFE